MRSVSLTEVVSTAHWNGHELTLPSDAWADLGRPTTLRVAPLPDGTAFAQPWSWRQAATVTAKNAAKRAAGIRTREGVRRLTGTGPRFTGHIPLAQGDYGLARFPPLIQLIPARTPEQWWRDAAADYPEHRPGADQDASAHRLTEWLAGVLQPLGRSFLEAGCGAGRNLAALSGDRYGIEINAHAARRARATGATVYEGDLLDELRRLPDALTDVAFTCGVLTHVPHDRVHAIVSELRRVAGTVVLAEMHGDPRPYDFWRYPRNYSTLMPGHYHVFDEGDWRNPPGFLQCLLISPPPAGAR